MLKNLYKQLQIICWLKHSTPFGDPGTSANEHNREPEFAHPQDLQDTEASVLTAVCSWQASMNAPRHRLGWTEGRVVSGPLK